MAPPKGSNHPCTKISEELARHLRRYWGNLTQKQRCQFAKVSGHSYTTLRNIATGRSWKYLDEPVIFKPKPRGQTVAKKRRAERENIR